MSEKVLRKKSYGPVKLRRWINRTIRSAATGSVSDRDEYARMGLASPLPEIFREVVGPGALNLTVRGWHLGLGIPYYGIETERQSENAASLCVSHNNQPVPPRQPISHAERDRRRGMLRRRDTSWVRPVRPVEPRTPAYPTVLNMLRLWQPVLPLPWLPAASWRKVTAPATPKLVLVTNKVYYESLNRGRPYG